MVNLNDVVSGVYARIGSANLPTTMTMDNLLSLADDVRIEIQSFTGTTIGSASFGETYLPAMRNTTSAYVMAYKLGVDIDLEIGIGTIQIAYRDKNAAENSMLKFFIERANSSLSNLGQKVAHNYTIKSDF